VDSVEYVQLETTDDCLLRPYIPYLDRYSNIVFISEFACVYKFDITTGKLSGKIGRNGQGPGEYLMMMSLSLNKDSNMVYILSRDKGIMKYDYDGKYLGIIYDSFIDSCIGAITLASEYNGSLLFITELIPAAQQWGCKPYELVLYDYKNKNILQSLDNRMGATYKKSQWNVAGNRKLSIEYVFAKMSSVRELYGNLAGKILIESVFIYNNCIFFRCASYTGEPGITDIFLCKYDCSTENPSYHKCYFENDIDGGANVRIKKLSTNFNAGLSILPHPDDFPFDKETLEYHYSSLDKSELKYPELKDKFEEMQKKRDGDDNPLLMILHKKQD
jgi:hypothetical protein